MNQEDFCDGVKILLARMETNPEDFDRELVDWVKNPLGTTTQQPKFSLVYDMLMHVVRGEDVKRWDDWQVLRKEEKSALLEGFKDMMRKRFSENIMKALMEEPETVERATRPRKKITMNSMQMEIAKKLAYERNMPVLEVVKRMNLEGELVEWTK